jgi:2-polyprenyl-3-methyl-5-hydroxy-6-metoxy-1,4-benzoquinol methylase
MKEMWNERFAGEEYAYGTEPNLFFKEKISGLEPGKLLLPAEGEGRNAVYAATLGWQVDAMDFSDQGKNKALKLAEQNRVRINYSIGDLFTFEYGYEIYDAAALIYAHMPDEYRKNVHRKIVESIKPGGYIILEAFNKNQPRYNSFGPKSVDMLYSTGLLAEDFKALDLIILEESVLDLRQGECHQGESAIIRMFGRKPSK